MARPFQRDNVLTAQERAKSARKCIGLLHNPEATIEMLTKDRKFLSTQQQASSKPGYAPTEPQLQWLRDMVDRYVTN